MTGDIFAGSRHGDQLGEIYNILIFKQFFKNQKGERYMILSRFALVIIRAGIVGFPNLVYISARFQLFCKGRVSVIPSLP